MNLTVDTRAFEAALKAKMPYMKKGLSEALNDEALKALIGAKGVKGAVQLAPKATKGRIKADLNKKVQAVNNRRFYKQAKTAAAASNARTKSAYHSVKLLYVLAAKSLKRRGVGKGMSPAAWRAAVAARAQEIAAKRDRSRGYIAAGFLACAADLSKGASKGVSAGLTRMHERDIISKKDMAKGQGEVGKGVPATAGNLTVTLYNNARGSGEIGVKAMQEGLNNAAKDMQVYVNRKLVEAWEKKR